MLLRHGVRLSPHLANIFDLIEHSGERGVTEEVLSSVFYSSKPKRDAYNCVRVNISHLNSYLVSTDYRVAKAGGVRGSEYPYRVLKENQATALPDSEWNVRGVRDEAPARKD